MPSMYSCRTRRWFSHVILLQSTSFAFRNLSMRLTFLVCWPKRPFTRIENSGCFMRFLACTRSPPVPKLSRVIMSYNRHRNGRPTKMDFGNDRHAQPCQILRLTVSFLQPISIWWLAVIFRTCLMAADHARRGKCRSMFFAQPAWLSRHESKQQTRLMA